MNNLLEDPMFAVVFILEYVIGEQLSAEDRRVRCHNTIYKKLISNLGFFFSSATF